MPETPNLDAQVNGPQYLGPATFMKVRALTVEVSPPYDHAEITAQNANRCIVEAISALAVKKSRGGTL